MIKVYNRETGQYSQEVQYGEKQLVFLYHTVIGRILLKVITTKGFSQLNAKFNDGKKSCRKIEPFIRKYNIKIDDFEKKSYHSFNDFFTRKLSKNSRNICSESNRLIAPADAKLIVYPISESLLIHVKNSTYSLKELLKDDALASKYKNGLCLVYRLSVDDYHRYCFIEDGKVTKTKHINGKLHTVSSISQDYKVFIENQREYQVIDMDNLGMLIQMEVGALLVGKIVNTTTKVNKKGTEKGYFSYGGSTIIVLIEENRVTIDSDIAKESHKNIETKIHYGEGIGDIL